jgi:hypothetical protein
MAAKGNRTNKRRSWGRRLHAGKRADNCLNIPGILCPLNTHAACPDKFRLYLITARNGDNSRNSKTDIPFNIKTILRHLFFLQGNPAMPVLSRWEKFLK